jgi:hypothetical protein
MRVLLQAQQNKTGLQPQQNKTDFKAALEAKGFGLAAALFDIANMTAALNRPAAVDTVLV